MRAGSAAEDLQDAELELFMSYAEVNRVSCSVPCHTVSVCMPASHEVLLR